MLKIRKLSDEERSETFPQPRQRTKLVDRLTVAYVLSKPHHAAVERYRQDRGLRSASAAIREIIDLTAGGN